MLSHSTTAILLNEGQTAYIYGRGFYHSINLNPDNTIYHVEVSDSYKAIAKPCEILDDDNISILGKGQYMIYAKEI